MSSTPDHPRTYQQGRISATSGVGAFAEIPKAERVAFYDRGIVLSRIFAHDAQSWVLKGGSALIWRDPSAQATRDLDIYHSTDRGIDDALTSLRAAVATTSLAPSDVDLRIRDDETQIQETGIRHSAAVRVRLYSAAGMELSQPVKIDLVTGCQVTGSIDSQPQDGISKALRAEFPHIRLYPIVDHLADKVAATMQTYPSSRGPAPSTRVRDLVDIAHIAVTETIDGDELITALDSERLERGLPAYTQGFQCPPGWEKLYPKKTRQRGSAPAKFDDALHLATQLINPAIFRDVSGMTWAQGRWG